MISVTLNGKPRELDSPLSVTAFLKTLDINARQVAVALGGDVVPRSQGPRGTTDGGDTIAVVGAVGARASLLPAKAPWTK